MMRRSVAVALGITCIILAVGLVGAIANYALIISDRDNTIASLNSQVFQLNTNATNMQKQIDSLNSNVTSLQNQVDNLTDALNLGESTVWVSGGTVNIMDGSPTYEENAAFAGYISVEVSSQYNVTVEVGYLSHGVSHQNSIIVGNIGTAFFPVLPSSNISIYIFQTFSIPFILTGPLYATATITYYY